MTTDMHVLESGDMILLDVPAPMRESVLQRLDQFIFTEEVQLGDLTDALRGIEVHGPGSGAVVEATTVGLTGVAEWPAYHNTRRDFGGSSVVVARIDQLGVPGYTLYVEAARATDLIAALVRHGAKQVGHEAVTNARVEAGYPLFGVDMNEDIIPLEAGIEDRAISLTKGCYVGQEVIIRVLHRGQGRVVRKLVGLRLEGMAIPPHRATINAGEREIGFVTSAVGSLRFGAIALGYVHRDFVAPGTTVDIEWTDGKATAVVSALPFS
jgi:folate-binding protein YgfZ